MKLEAFQWSSSNLLLHPHYSLIPPRLQTLSSSQGLLTQVTPMLWNFWLLNSLNFTYIFLPFQSGKYLFFYDPNSTSLVQKSFLTPSPPIDECDHYLLRAHTTDYIFIQTHNVTLQGRDNLFIQLSSHSIQIGRKL